MISGIHSNNEHIIVRDGGGNAPYISPGAVGAGMVRWNNSTERMEVNDGNSWQTLPTSYATIDLSPETIQILTWARKQYVEDRRLQAMIDKYPALKKAKHNFDILLKLTKDDYDSTNKI